VQAHHQLRLVMGSEPPAQLGEGEASTSALLWDLQAEPFIGARAPAPAVAADTAPHPTLQEAA